jgi:Glycosyltransferase family 92
MVKRGHYLRSTPVPLPSRHHTHVRTQCVCGYEQRLCKHSVSGMLLCCAVLYSTLLYSTLLYSTPLYPTPSMPSLFTLLFLSYSPPFIHFSLYSSYSLPSPHKQHTQAKHHRALLIEWIEYHRLVGVQHFFIYDTYSGVLSSPSSSSSSSSSSSAPTLSPSISTSSSSSSSSSSVVSSARTYDTPLNSSRPSSPVNTDPVGAGKTLLEGAHTGDLRGALSDYIALGIVTLIPWHQQLCDKAVYSDRWVGVLFALHFLDWIRLQCIVLSCLSLHRRILVCTLLCCISMLCFDVVCCVVLCRVEFCCFSQIFFRVLYRIASLTVIIYLPERTNQIVRTVGIGVI